jgi:integrase
MKASEVFKLPDGLHRADECLYLTVKGKSRSWVFVTRINGKQVRRGLGTAQVMTLPVAKGLVLRVRAALAKGKTLDEALPRQKEKKVSDFESVAKEAIETRSVVAQFKETSRSKPRMEQYLRDYCKSLLKKDVAEITREDVLKCIKPIWFEKAHTAGRLRRFIRMVLNYALVKGLRTAANPADWEGGLEFLLPKEASIHTVVSRAAPSFEELKTACAALAKQKGVAARAILFGVLTCTRVSEFCKVRMCDIDMKEKCWTLPAESRKGHHTAPHRVPLSRQAMAIIRESKAENDAFIFPGAGGNPHLNPNTPRILINRVLPEAKTMHGVRSTFKDWATENGWDRDLSEKVLSHKLGRSDTEAAYLRTDLFKQRIPLMQAWADAVLDF